nr:MAG TPA: hypothetical protein [Caudoviricetes sp.]
MKLLILLLELIPQNISNFSKFSGFKLYITLLVAE